MAGNKRLYLGLTIRFLCLIIAATLLYYMTISQSSNPLVPLKRRELSTTDEVLNDKTDHSSLDQSPPSVQQNLQVAPPVPILELSRDFILSAIGDNIIQGANPITNSTLSAGHSSNPKTLNALVKRDAEPCATDRPCPDKSCCSTAGKCGYGPDYCGASNCVSNCDATAMCGKYSEGGSLKCGMNLCCSHYGWCGTNEVHCGNPDPHGLTPCQEGFGLCKTVPPPSCGGTSANGRTIGYYQASNTRDRLCSRISPSQIDTTGLTHLYFAFAKIDPASYAVDPATSGDTDIYSKFTALQSSSLKTWIAIGGFDFSDPGPTRNTWSDLVVSSANRAAFISDLKSFMSKYGFQGVDLDWEYPATPERGGRPEDTANFVLLVKEMKASFGDQYGISLTLAPDYWYLRGFDAKAMEPYVDFFGFMAYDLHGFWDADVQTLGSIVRAQTDIREIYNDTLPLWFDALDPSKINFGLAYYGRGYTLSDPSCNHLGCPFSGPSQPGPCTNYGGVLSLAEIKQYIRDKNLQPKLLQDSMIKQITWDDQWIGYDDADTVALKKKWASGLCFGGTMIWSVDFDASNGSDDDNPLNNAPSTTDGTCGPKNGGTVCGDWTDGGCCSSSGFCGSGPGFCGNGCQSGPCLSGVQTTDGTCGPKNGNSICGTFAGGSCCSAGGFCGGDDSHCGAGCISGPCDSATHSSGPSGDVYISPDVWTGGDSVINCIPPCVYILPPLILPSATTIIFPLLTTSLEVAWKTTKTTTLGNGQVTTSVGYDSTIQKTTLTIPPVTTDQIDLWNVNITAGASSSIVYITSSIAPPPFTITDDRNPKSSPGVTHPVVHRTITPPVYPYTTSPSHDHPPLTHSSGTPKHPCRIGCGHRCGGLFCNKPCLLNCSPHPPGFHDPIDPNPGNDDPDPNNPDEPDNNPTASPTSCTKTSTVTDYWVSCTSLGEDSSSCTTTSTSIATGCDVTASATTTGADSCPIASKEDDQGEDGAPPKIPASATAHPTITPGPKPSCSYHGPDPQANVPEGYCICDDKTFAELPGTSSCDYSTMPTQTTNPQQGSLPVVTSNCQVCTQVNANQNACETVPGCTPTGTPIEPAPPEATCYARSTFNHLEVRIYTNYIKDDGAALFDALDHTCNADQIAAWKPVEETTHFTAEDKIEWDADQHFDFNYDIRLPQGLFCVPKAIKKAGGPDTPACDFDPLLNPP